MGARERFGSVKPYIELLEEKYRRGERNHAPAQVLLAVIQDMQITKPGLWRRHLMLIKELEPLVVFPPAGELLTSARLNAREDVHSWADFCQVADRQLGGIFSLMDFLRHRDEALAIKTANERMTEAAVATSAEKVLPKHVTPDVQFAHQKADSRALSAGVSLRSQRKLDRLAREAPELLVKVQAGDMSCHAAAVQAGIVRPTWTAPADPERLAAAVCKRFPGWEMRKVS